MGRKICLFLSWLGLVAVADAQKRFDVVETSISDNLRGGLQFVGRLFDEPTLIRYTYGYEQAMHHRVAPARFPAFWDGRK